VRSVVVVLILACAAVARADKVDDLSRAVLSDPSWRVRVQAVVVLGKLKDLRAVPALRGALHDGNDTVRALAAEVLGDLHAADAVPGLEALANDKSALVRSKAQAALGKLHGEEPPDDGSLHVQVGGVIIKARNVPPEIAARLKEMVERELRRTPGVTVVERGEAFTIDSSVTSLTRRNVGEFVEINCEVSYVVGKLPSRAMVMMTSGGGTAQAPRNTWKPAHERALQVDALEGAVHGAHENLLAFLRTQQKPSRKR
jgi:hypothetical protein